MGPSEPLILAVPTGCHQRAHGSPCAPHRPRAMPLPPRGPSWHIEKSTPSAPALSPSSHGFRGDRKGYRRCLWGQVWPQSRNSFGVPGGNAGQRSGWTWVLSACAARDEASRAQSWEGGEAPGRKRGSACRIVSVAGGLRETDCWAGRPRDGTTAQSCLAGRPVPCAQQQDAKESHREGSCRPER